MILLHVVTKSKRQANEIADFLIEKKLILDAVILEKVGVREKSAEGEVVTVKKIMIMGKTKSLLFPYIDKKLRAKYPDKMPVLYSVAIVNMDWEQANELIQETAKV
jgi:uncharacterized protein involved in tolerance to divalent cations